VGTYIGLVVQDMSEDNIVIRGHLYEICDCPVCGVIYTVSRRVRNAQREEGGRSYCPNGHHIGWADKESREARLGRERDLLKQQAARYQDEIALQIKLREQTQDKLTSLVEASRRLKKRMAAGVCPCCKRTFTALQRHMTTKHPGFKAEGIK
jgi:hypothetical protein